MLKLLGAFLILFSTGLLGLTVAKSLAARPNQLKRLRTALMMLETEINYTSTLLPEALQKLACKTNSPISILLLKASEQLYSGEGLSAEEAWSNALDFFQKGSALNSYDLAILQDFGAGLGNSDKEDQVKKLQLIREQLLQQEELAEAERLQSERMWRTMGVLAGLALVILLY